jgi:hypothetical protein
VFDGFDDIYVKAALLDNFDKKHYWRLARHELVFSLRFMFAIFLLPRQFHTAIVENNSENIFEQHYGFSHCIYFFNIFVFPIAWAATSF